MKSCVLKVYIEERKRLIRKVYTELDHIDKIPSPPTVADVLRRLVIARAFDISQTLQFERETRLNRHTISLDIIG